MALKLYDVRNWNFAEGVIVWAWVTSDAGLVHRVRLSESSGRESWQPRGIYSLHHFSASYSWLLYPWNSDSKELMKLFFIVVYLGKTICHCNLHEFWLWKSINYPPFKIHLETLILKKNWFDIMNFSLTYSFWNQMIFDYMLCYSVYLLINNMYLPCFFKYLLVL